jgi:hypothetical protein
MKILKQASTLCLMGMAIVCGVPLSAQANSAVVQTVTQEAVINGDNNQIIQVINQVNVKRQGQNRGRKTGHTFDRDNSNNGNSAVVQDAYQGATINGNDNVAIQEIAQENRVSGGDAGRDRSQGRRGHQEGDDDHGKSKKQHQKHDDD